MGQKQAFFEFVEKIGTEFLLSLYYLVCCCKNSIFEKFLVSEMWPKMFSGNHFEEIFH